MPTRRIPKARMSDVIKAVHSYIYYRDQAATARKEQAKIYTPAKWESSAIVQEILANGERDESTGSVFWSFDEPLTINDATYKGMEWRRTQGSQYLDEEAALKLVESKGIAREEVGHYEYVLDHDALYVLNQRGKLTDDELDSILLEAEPSYSLQVTRA